MPHNPFTVLQNLVTELTEAWGVETKCCVDVHEAEPLPQQCSRLSSPTRQRNGQCDLERIQLECANILKKIIFEGSGFYFPYKDTWKA